MSRYRAVKCMIWNDDKFPFLDDDSQLVWFHSYTYPYSNGLGMYMASIEALAANKRWSAERYRKGFENLLSNGLVRYDDTYHVVWFPKYLEHNKPDNPNSLKGVLKFWNEIPNGKLKIEFYQILKVYCANWGPKYLEVYETLPTTSNDRSRNTDPDPDPDPDPKILPFQEGNLININTSNTGGDF